VKIEYKNKKNNNRKQRLSQDRAAMMSRHPALPCRTSRAG